VTLPFFSKTIDDGILLMSNLNLFKIWAPDDRVWSDWAKPVLFAQNPLLMEHRQVLPPWPTLDRLQNDRATALLIDLPREQSVDYGIAAARIGFWPIPLFNCAFNIGAVLDVRPIFTRLQSGAEELTRLNLPAVAPPAFLVDSRRMNTDVPLLPGNFDNRYIMLPQDFPSAGFLKAHGISRVIWIRTTPTASRLAKDDLAHILRRWQEGGLAIFEFHIADYQPHPIDVPKPPMFRNIFHRALSTMGLRRNNAGGFGAVIPHPSSGG
jgi:hypothetical protein